MAWVERRTHHTESEGMNTKDVEEIDRDTDRD